MRDRTDRAIGRAALGISAVLILGVALTGWLALRRPPQAPTAYRVGERVDLPARYFEGHAATLVIVTKAGCAACERCAAFHQSLREAALSAGVDVQWIHAEQTPEGDLGRIHVVPSLVLLNSAGIVLEMKEGALPEDEQRALMERVRRTPGT